MPKKFILVAALGGLLAVTAHAQYTTPVTASGTNEALNSGAEGDNRWEVDGGFGYLADTNIGGATDGWTAHIGGYYLDPINSTHETTLKYGLEYFHGDASGTDNGAETDLTTNFVSANLGIAYRLSRHFEVSVLAGVGGGQATLTRGGYDNSTGLLGYQFRPEVTAWINDNVGVSLGYRFLEAASLSNSWGKNPLEQAVEFSVKVRF